MKIIIIPGFVDSPEGTTFPDLEKILVTKGHSVIKTAWPYLPDELDKYSISSAIAHAREVLKNIEGENLAILGFSMGGIIATFLAAEFHPKKLGLIVSPYQAGTDDDLTGKYKAWKEAGYRVINTRKFGDLKIPFSFIEDARKYNALDFISQINCPKLFVVGEKDTKVQINASKKLFEKANGIKDWYQIPNMEHEYQHQAKMLKKVNEIIANFIETVS